ncbi:heteropolysaccharide repeat unit export protein [Lachnospiraceae bacterium KM106-2]|nr:heteropolysaccharide repeat unit export protein [Lachnospiraceae bacterium KM106-2]
MNKVIQFFKGNGKNIETKGVIWNIIGSTLYSAMSAILLIVVSRVNGTNAAGLFTLTFSVSQMMYTIANYGMRNYQSSDINEKYSFSTYLNSRILTCIIMMICTLGYVIFKGYGNEKIMLVIVLCMLKVTDALGDLYEGAYQINKRLDISGKTWSARVLIYMMGFSVTLVFTRDLLLSGLVAVAISVVLLVYFTYITRNEFIRSKQDEKWKNTFSLLYECLPLCIAGYLIVYLNNAPRYAIDEYMSLDSQAIYGYLFMPCFIINLMIQTILRPLLLKLSILWNEKEYNKFKKMICQIIGLTLVIAVFIMIGGYLLGCSVLSIIYNTDLMPYRNIFMMLLVGGTIYSLAVVIHVLLTVMRCQFMPIIGFGIAAISAIWICPFFVSNMQLEGAAYSYIAITGILLISFSIMLVAYFAKFSREGVNEES